MEKLNERIKLLRTDVNSNSAFYEVTVKLDEMQFRELAGDLEYNHQLDEFIQPKIQAYNSKYYGTKGVKIVHFNDKLEVEIMQNGSFTINKVFLMIQIVADNIKEYIDSNDYKGFQNDGLYKIHIAKENEVIDLLSKYYEL